MFYRASEKSKGSGLGLYIVQETIQKMNGKIKVASDVGVGTSFEIEVPV
jgi:signal transduction histidine kinase